MIVLGRLEKFGGGGFSLSVKSKKRSEKDSNGRPGKNLWKGDVCLERKMVGSVNGIEGQSFKKIR